MLHLARKTVDICANCGLVAKDAQDDFKCTACGCDVCVVVPYPMFLQMIKLGVAKE